MQIEYYNIELIVATFFITFARECMDKHKISTESNRMTVCVCAEEIQIMHAR